MIETLANYIFAAMISWVPISDHSYYEKPEITTARYHDIANSIVEVALDPEQEPLFAEEDGRIKTALLLASVASSEGFFRKDIDSCKIGGDHGLAWGLWQTHAPKKLVCSDRKAAIIIALNMMKQSFIACKKLPVLDRMSVYTDGQCHSNWFRSRYKMSRAINYLSNHRLETENAQYTSQHN
jgi:hypothetical protein